MCFQGEARLILALMGEPLPHPDPLCTDPETDLEEPIHLPADGGVSYPYHAPNACAMKRRDSPPRAAARLSTRPGRGNTLDLGASGN